MSIKVKKYQNGATLVYRKVKRKHTAVTAGFVFGRNHDKYPEPVAHFCEHMFFKETTSRNEKQLRQDMLNTFSMKNGRTYLFYTEIDFCRANKALENCFALSSDMLLNTKFSPKCVKSEKGVIKQELVRKLNNPDAIFWYTKSRCLSNEYTQTTQVLGSEAEIDAITPKVLKNFRDDVFISQNFVIVIEGGISYAKAKRMAEKYFIRNLKSNPAYPQDRTMEPNYDRKGNLLIEKYPFNKAICEIIIKIDKELENQKTKELILMLRMLCNSVDGKLSGRLRNHGLVYDSMMNASTSKDHFCLNIKMNSSPENINKCIDQVGILFKELRSTKVDEDLIAKKKENIKLEKDEFVQQIYPSRLFSRYLTFGEEIFTKKYEKQSKKIFQSLTAEDLQSFCKTILSKPENIYVAILTGEKDANFYDYEKIQKILTK